MFDSRKIIIGIKKGIKVARVRASSYVINKKIVITITKPQHQKISHNQI